MGSALYAAEEMRVEMASGFIGATLNIPAPIENQASYIGHWLKSLKNDKREIFKAASEAQRIADYLLAFHPEYKPQAQPSPAGEATLADLPRPVSSRELTPA